MQTSAFLRAKNVEVCGIGALALYFFSRFNHEQDPLPDLNQRRNWYNIRVYRSPGDATKSLDYATQYVIVQAILREIGVSTSKVTHVCRDSVVKQFSHVIEDRKLERGGNWLQAGAMASCYATVFPVDLAMAIGGFDHSQKSFFLPRACVNPSEALLAKVFPGKLN